MEDSAYYLLTSCDSKNKEKEEANRRYEAATNRVLNAVDSINIDTVAENIMT